MKQADIPTTMGVGPGKAPEPEAMETDKDTSVAPQPPEKKYYIDSTYLYTPREGMDLLTPLKDGLSKNCRPFCPATYFDQCSLLLCVYV